MVGFPTALIYLAKKFGGLGIKRFSDEVQIDKLSKVFSALRSSSLHALVTAGILNRAARCSGLNPLPGQPVVIHPRPATQKK
jgi:chromosome condensin MukBEF ATPase and DNA-binding subunit MukB